MAVPAAAALVAASLAVAWRSGAPRHVLAAAAGIGLLVAMGWLGTGLVLQDELAVRLQRKIDRGTKAACFREQKTLERQGDGFRVQAKKPFGTGRARYNCTAPADEAGRFFWYTQSWIIQ